MVTVNIDGKGYKKLPDIPVNTTELHCKNNKIRKITKLPYGLKALYCSHNKITELTNLPNTLEELNCDNNKLTYIPHLPPSVLMISMDNNPLEEPYKSVYKEYSDTQNIDDLHKDLHKIKPIVETNVDYSTNENMHGGYRIRGRSTSRRRTRRRNKRPKSLLE